MHINTLNLMIKGCALLNIIVRSIVCLLVQLAIIHFGGELEASTPFSISKSVFMIGIELVIHVSSSLEKV